MRRSFIIRQVFAELRHALGNEIPAIELLQFAAKLVDATRTPLIRDDEKFVSVRPAIDELPMDKAFADGGWRIMARERLWVPETEWDDDPSFSVANANFRKLEFAV